jgi:putative ABC transport system ATP-binding protein
MTTISLHGVHKTYRHGGNDVHALRGADLEVPAGQMLALTGRSGSGKTTIMNLIAGLLRADSGTIEVDGLDVTAASEAQLIELRRDRLGVIYQDFALLPLLTAEENVGLPLRIARVDPKERDAVVTELLERVGLAGHMKQRPDELSGGQQQRVAIARALANRPRVLLADEPTGQLDSETGAAVMQLLRQLVNEEGATAIIATHDPSVEAVADAVVHLADGRLAEASPVAR